jgi:hypothetical protein
MKNNIQDYIFEQILILERKQELLEENKVLAGLTALAIAGAAYFAQGYLQNDNISTNDVANKAVKSQKLTQKQISQIKKGAELAKRMINKGMEPEKISSKQKESNVSSIFKALFNNKFSKYEMSAKNMPIASAEDIDLNEMFFFTQEELDRYFDMNENVLLLDDGTSLLDFSAEELNSSLSDPSSDAVKIIAREILTASVIESDFLKASRAIFDEYDLDDSDQLKTSLRSLEKDYEKEFYRIKSIKNFLNKNVVDDEAKSTLKDILRSARHITTSEAVDSWINDYSRGEKVNDKGQFIDGYSDYEDDGDYVDLDNEFKNRSRRNVDTDLSSFFSDERE